jgi:archaemetzincin
MDPYSITLVCFGQYEEDFLKKISEAVHSELLLPVNIREGHIDLSEFYDPVRRQYNGMKLLNAVDSLYSTELSKCIGLFNVDIFIPILTYIFGQAFLNGRTGIASIYRFNNERYGINSNNSYILERAKKEIIHELGHTMGLIHCHVPTCVMRSSTYVEDIDQKGSGLCASCRRIVQNASDL